MSNSIKVRFSNKNTFEICKISEKRKVTNTPPIKQQSHFGINFYFKFLLKKSTDVNLLQ